MRGKGTKKQQVTCEEQKVNSGNLSENSDICLNFEVKRLKFWTEKGKTCIYHLVNSNQASLAFGKAKKGSDFGLFFSLKILSKILNLLSSL